MRRAGGEGATRAPKSATLEPKPVLGVIAAATTDERALARAPQRATATVVALATWRRTLLRTFCSERRGECANAEERACEDAPRASGVA